MAGRAQRHRQADSIARVRRQGQKLELTRIAVGSVAAIAAIAAATALAAKATVAPSALAAPSDFEWNLPPGFPVPRVPADNPMSDAKVDLGRRLFFDTRLSITHQYACASCHRPEFGFTDARGRAVGATGAILPRGAMSLYNVAYSTSFGWRKPGFGSLESQMRQPLFNRHPVEMGLQGHERELIATLAADPDTRQRFMRAFPDASPPVSIRHLIQAIACYERTLISGRSPFDRYVFDDDASALDDGAKRGMQLFYSRRSGCSGCHDGIAFAGPAAIARRPVPRAVYADTGTGGVFKIPGLRNLRWTAPYMHDGRFADLPAVIAHYENPRRGAQPGESLDRRLRPLRLAPGEKQDLIDFLQALSGLQFETPSTSDSAAH